MYLEQKVEQLEKEVSELKLIVHELRKPYTVVEDKPKTPNELRGEIIEKAKQFVESDEHKDFDGDYHVRVTGIGTVCCTVEFVVNERKRTVVALLKGITTKKVRARVIAKCNPSDVFNSHIGKAIALGRALGLDVSEFEQGVQPTTPVSGMYCKHKMTKNEGELTEFNQPLNHWESNGDIWGSHPSNLTIINDTNAIYGGKKQ